MKDRKHGLACQIKLMPNVNAENLKIPLKHENVQNYTIWAKKHCFLLRKDSWESAHKSNLRLGIRTRPGPDLDPTSTLYFRIDDFAWTSINFHAICFQSRPWRPFAIDSNQVFLAFECGDQLVLKLHYNKDYPFRKIKTLSLDCKQTWNSLKHGYLFLSASWSSLLTLPKKPKKRKSKVTPIFAVKQMVSLLPNHTNAVIETNVTKTIT